MAICLGGNNLNFVVNIYDKALSMMHFFQVQPYKQNRWVPHPTELTSLWLVFCKNANLPNEIQILWCFSITCEIELFGSS